MSHDKHMIYLIFYFLKAFNFKDNEHLSYLWTLLSIILNNNHY